MSQTSQFVHVLCQYYLWLPWTHTTKFSYTIGPHEYNIFPITESSGLANTPNISWNDFKTVYFWLFKAHLLSMTWFSKIRLIFNISWSSLLIFIILFDSAINLVQINCKVTCLKCFSSIKTTQYLIQIWFYCSNHELNQPSSHRLFEKEIIQPGNLLLITRDTKKLYSFKYLEKSTIVFN